MLEKKECEEIHRSLSNAEMRVTEFEPIERHNQSDSIQISRK
jgi:hypothetical protein